MMDISKRVLVVDDEDSVRPILQRMLLQEGYHVLTAASGQEALDMLTQSGTRVVLLDIRMPVMSGVDTLRQIMTNWPDTCVVMATAVTDIQTAVECMKLGAYDYIAKPFDRQTLVATLQSAVAKRDMRMEEERQRLDLTKRVTEQSERLREMFGELVETLAREHKLLYTLASQHPEQRKAILSELPPELQQPMSSVQEFRDALLRILRRGS